MLYRHFRKIPRAYDIELRADGRVNVWLCNQVDTYRAEDGSAEYDVELRVVDGVEMRDDLEADIREHFYDWWESAQSDSDCGIV